MVRANLQLNFPITKKNVSDSQVAIREAVAMQSSLI